MKSAGHQALLTGTWENLLEISHMSSGGTSNKYFMDHDPMATEGARLAPSHTKFRDIGITSYCTETKPNQRRGAVCMFWGKGGRKKAILVWACLRGRRLVSHFLISGKKKCTYFFNVKCFFTFGVPCPLPDASPF